MADYSDILIMLGEISADQRTMKTDISEIKKKVEDVHNFRVRVIAYCTGASAAVTVLFGLAKDSIASVISRITGGG